MSRAKSGTYCAPPVRRVHIPKGDGRKTRPIGIPTFEDKVLQRAVAMVLDAVYEQNFRDCSYGFRPGRSAHQALQTLWERLMAVGGGWVLELDIEDFFGSLDRGRLREILQQRVRDGVLLLAVSLSAVFFGAMSYLGNGPNFMVKSICEKARVPTPSFLSYVLQYSLPVLLPVSTALPALPLLSMATALPALPLLSTTTALPAEPLVFSAGVSPPLRNTK